LVRRAECPVEPPTILQGVTPICENTWSGELCLEGDNRIVQGSMSDMLAAWIEEEAIAIEYRLDRGRAPCRVAFPKTS
jgi:hypothetical protein